MGILSHGPHYRICLHCVSKEDLNVYIEEDFVRLSGQTARDDEFRDEHTYRTERHYGSFSRIIPLPAEVKPDQAKAEYRDGILAIRIPKTGQSRTKGKKVDINEKEPGAPFQI